MNEDPLTVTLTQISQLVVTLNKKNVAQSSRQINQLVKEFGFEADRHYLRCLFSAIDFGDAPQVSKSSVQGKLLNTELSSLITKPNYVSSICFAVDHCFEIQKSLKPTAHLFTNLTKALNLTAVKEVVLAYSLTHSEHPDLRHLATEHLQTSLLKLIQSHIEVESPSGNSESGLHDVTPELLQLILSLLVHEKYEAFGLAKPVFDKFIAQLCHDFPRDHVPLVLAPLLYADEETEVGVDVVAGDTQSILQSSPIMDTSWSKLVMEIGYGFTASVEECKNHLVKVGGREIKNAEVAKIIGVMCQTHTGLSESSINLPTPANFWPANEGGKDASSPDASNKTPTSGTPAAGGGGVVPAPGTPATPGAAPGDQTATWKPEVFVQALKEVCPTLKWEEVCFGLDNPDFALKDRQGLMVLLSILRVGYQKPFPAQILYRHWDNSGAQLSLYYQILKNPDLMSFADYIIKPVITDPLKTPPELDNKEVATWKSLHLIEVLLHLADNGFYAKVNEIFKIPIQLCPDLFFFALLQINTPASLLILRHELFVRLMPIFLGNHPNSGPVIQHAWNSASLKTVVLNSIIEWYYRGENDQTRLSRILDVAQDLKALSSLLTVQAFPFSIDLACLASRRGYLKLEKWWNDQVREHRQLFIQATVNFLQRKCPQSIGGKIPEDQLPKAAQLPPETMTTLITCLQSCIGNVSPELHEMIIAMSTHCNMLLNSTRQQQQQQQQQLPPPAVLRAAGVPPPPQGQGQQPPQQQQQQQQQMRALESQLHAANLSGQIFANQNVDAFTSAMSGLNLGGGGGNNNFNFNMLSNIVSTPVSPSRLLSGGGGAPSHSPFSVMAAANQSMNLGATVSNRIQSTPPTGDKQLIPNQNVMFPEIAGNISKEIEDEANSYFQRIYNHPPHPTLSIEEVLEMLQRFQESQNRRERGVYQCMVRNLFEEYRFFPNYPDKELQITAQLFGGMVDRKLVADFVVLGLALRCVLDALRKPDSSKMYFFGITALDRFKTKLHLYQKYCEYVRSIAHFDQFPPHLIEYVEYGVNGQEPPTKPQGSIMPQMLASTTSNALYNRSNSVTSNLSMTGGSQSAKSGSTPGAGNAGGAGGQGSSAAITQSRVKSIASATNIDTLLVANQDREEKITAPPDAIQDKTAFIFNNLSQLNLQQKCEEVKEIMTKEYWSWMAQYLVLKRASIEFNFHSLYSNFLDVLKIPDINRMVTRETFRNIRVLLRSDKSIANFSDRSLLKNLGHWLGMMTLGRSRPILQIDIDLKSLLAEAYMKGQQELLYIVPFVAKVLESCAKSRVFKLPNPWTMAIMNVLAELHQEPDLKLNLKFEIEVLCKNFNIDVSDLKPAVYLKEAEKNVTEFQLSADKHQMKDVLMQSPIQQQMQSNATPSLLGAGNMGLLAPSGSRGDDVSSGMNSTVSPSPGLDGVSGGALVSGPPEPKFSYMSINVGNLNSIGQLMTIAPNMPMFHAQPHLKSIVRVAIERTIGEWLSPVVDRSVKIALTSCEQIIRKDFALDMEEMHMRTAAHYMVRNLTAGMAMITCREQLSQALIGNIKNALLSSLTPQQKELAESAALQVAADNMELACAFIQKTAIERAVQDIDKRLNTDYELRKHARMEGRTILDQETYTYQCERMPEQIRLTGNITKHQFAVYEEFVKNIPGFVPIAANEVGMFFPKQQQQQQQPPQQQQQQQQTPAPEMFAQFGGGGGFGMNASGASGAVAPAPASAHSSSPYPGATGNFLTTPEDALVMYEELMTKMDAFIVSVVTIPALQVQLKNIHTLYDILRRNRDSSNTMTLQTKAVEFLLEGYVNLPEHVEHIKMYRDILLRQLRILQDSYDLVTTKAVFECREEVRYNLEAIDVLITNNFINFDHFDPMMGRSMENGNNYLAVNFAMKLVQRYLIDRSFPLINEKDFGNTVEMLNRIAVHPAAPEGLVHLMEILRLSQEQNLLAGGGGGGQMLAVRGGGAVAGGPGVHDDASLQQKIEYLLKDWVTIFHRQARDPSKALSVFLNKLNVYGVELLKFLQHATKICIDLSYRQLADQSTPPGMAKIKIFHWIDPYVRLITLLMKLSGSDSQTKINLLTKVLYILAEALLKDHEKQGVNFQQVGFHRMLIMLFLELSTPDPVLESISLNVVAMFAHTFHLIRPMMAPGFCYAWLECISHRVFLNRCLAVMGQQKGWGIYSQLLLDLFNYLAPFLRNAELAKPVHLMYKGTLRILLVLLHDFPEFLCDYHFSFCDVIPPNCIQMRNLILSAFPENMRMPDPFTPNLKVDMLPETANPPRILTNFAENITPIQFRQSLDSYLKTRAPVTFLSELRGCLQISNEPGSRYNIPLMNALVLYVGTQAIAHIRSKNLAPNMNTIVHSAHMDIFQNLSVDLENEGRYLFLNAIANQLRYPNSLTNYFSCVLLYLFVEANSEAIQEQITRVLVERLIVNRPHPWGLLITFIELIKNPVYKFWDHEFVHCAPEMTRLFESVARFCTTANTNSQQQLGNFETEGGMQECN